MQLKDEGHRGRAMPISSTKARHISRREAPLTSALGRIEGMYAIVRMNTMDEVKVAGASAQLEEFRALHSGLAGYVGSLSVEAGDGKVVVVNLWESRRHAADAL